MARRSVWQSIKELPPFVASVIAIIAAIGTAAAWIVGYFATKSELDHVSCISNHNEQLLSSQVKAANSYTNYIKAKAKLAELEQRQSVGGNVDKEEFIALDTDAKRYWNSLEKATAVGDDIASFLQSGGCGKGTVL